MNRKQAVKLTPILVSRLVAAAKLDPELRKTELAVRFGLAPKTVSRVLHEAGVRPLKVRT